MFAVKGAIGIFTAKANPRPGAFLSVSILPRSGFDGKHWCYPDDLESRIDNAEEYTVPRKTAIRCLETGKMYESIADASRDTGINHNSIRAVARGDRHKAGGYT